MDSKILTQHSLTGQHYGYSAADLGDLDAPEYTLVTLIVDESSSVSPFKTEMEKCIKEAIKACKFSQRSDYLLIRLVTFNQTMREIHGFKQLVDCDLNDYDNCLNTFGSTALFSTSKNAIDATNDYGKQLVAKEFEANAIIFIITDGDDNSSGSITMAQVESALKDAMKDEALESIMSVLVGVGVGSSGGINQYLSNFKDNAGLNQYVGIEDANDKTLAKLAQFISQSVSSQSRSLRSGAMSQPLNF